MAIYVWTSGGEEGRERDLMRCFEAMMAQVSINAIHWDKTSHWDNARHRDKTRHFGKPATGTK